MRIRSLTRWTSMVLVLGWTPITGPGAKAAPPTSRPATNRPAGMDRNHLNKVLERLPELLDEGNLLSAQLLREEIKKTPMAMGSKFKAIEREFEKQAKELELEITDEYLWVHKPVLDKAWRSAMGKAKDRMANTYPKSGLAAIRIRFEDTTREERVGAMAQQLHIYFTEDAGYGGYRAVKSGDFLLLGRSSSKRSDGTLEIQAMGHACPKLQIEVPDEGSTGLGEVLVRTAPQDKLGSLRVTIEPEGGAKVRDAVVRVGRRIAPYDGGYAVGPDLSYTIKNLAAGPCDLYSVAGDDFTGAHRKATVEAGETTDVTLPLYARREIEIEYKFRSPAGDGDWDDGTATMLTGKCLEGTALGRGQLPVLCVDEWDGRQARIRPCNGRLLPGSKQDFGQATIASADEFKNSPFEAYPVLVGKVFQLRYRVGNTECETIFRVKSIESIAAVKESAGSRPAE